VQHCLDRHILHRHPRPVSASVPVIATAHGPGITFDIPDPCPRPLGRPGALPRRSLNGYPEDPPMIDLRGVTVDHAAHDRRA
jgi:hypothetical protein